jgi:hypothetical protein
MTAHGPTPTAEHIDATDYPTMLDALVRAGVLTESRRTLPDGWAGQTADGEGNVTMMLRPNTVQRQYATRWEVAP